MDRVIPRTGRTLRETYEDYLPMVYRIAFTYLKSKSDSEDAAQETFLRLLRQTTPFQNAEHLKAWMIVTVTNVSRDMLRRKYRQDLGLETVQEVAAKAETGNELLDTVLALPENYKTVVYLYYYEGYAVKEIASMLHLTTEAVKTRLRRAREKLKSCLEELENEE